MRPAPASVARSRRPLQRAALLAAGASALLCLLLLRRETPAAVAAASAAVALPASPAGLPDAEPALATAIATPPPALEPAPDLAGLLDELTREFPFGRERQSVLREIIEDAPPEAVEALLRLAFVDPERNDLSHVLLERLSALAPDAAIAFAREHRFGDDPPWWHSVIGGLADPLAAAADIRALPANDARAQFLGHIALRAALASPPAALEFARSLSPGREQDLALANAIAGAARLDPSAGLDLAAAHAPAADRPALLRGLAADWAMNDYPAAAARIRALPPGETRQAALAGLAAVAVERDFAAAWPLAAELREEAARRDIHLQLAKTWLLRDSAAADRWLDATPELDAAAKAEAREFLRLSRRAP